MNIAGRNRRDFFYPSNVQTSVQSRAHIEYLRCGHSLYGEMQFGACDSAARRCAPFEAETLPGRLRRCTAHDPTPLATTASREFRSHKLAAPVAIPHEPFIASHPDTGPPDTRAAEPERCALGSHR